MEGSTSKDTRPLLGKQNCTQESGPIPGVGAAIPASELSQQGISRSYTAPTIFTQSARVPKKRTGSTTSGHSRTPAGSGPATRRRKSSVSSTSSRGKLAQAFRKIGFTPESPFSGGPDYQERDDGSNTSSASLVRRSTTPSGWGHPLPTTPPVVDPGRIVSRSSTYSRASLPTSSPHLQPAPSLGLAREETTQASGHHTYPYGTAPGGRNNQGALPQHYQDHSKISTDGQQMYSLATPGVNHGDMRYATPTNMPPTQGRSTQYTQPEYSQRFSGGVATQFTGQQAHLQTNASGYSPQGYNSSPIQLLSWVPGHGGSNTGTEAFPNRIIQTPLSAEPGQYTEGTEPASTLPASFQQSPSNPSQQYFSWGLGGPPPGQFWSS